MATRVSYRGFLLDQPTINALSIAEKILGYQLDIAQGSWSSGVAASAGTHDGGGAIDIRIKNADGSLISTAEQVRRVRALRQAGFAAWRRTPDEGFAYHIHCILRGDYLVSPSAAAQIVQWNSGKNGLADHGPDSDAVDVAAGRPPLWVPPVVQLRPLIDMGQ